jgi:hypothetical protein
MAEVQWYYARNDQQFGPVSAAELKQLADDGKLSPDDLLWREGMDSWNTAINLRGLFSDDAAPGKGLAEPIIAPPRTEAQHAPHRPPANGSQASSAVSLRSLLRSTQIILWTICVLVVLAGVILFTRAFLSTNEPSEQAAAGAIFSTFFIAAYVLARTGEKLSRLLLAASRRRSR